MKKTLHLLLLLVSFYSTAQVSSNKFGLSIQDTNYLPHELYVKLRNTPKFLSENSGNVAVNAELPFLSKLPNKFTYQSIKRPFYLAKSSQQLRKIYRVKIGDSEDLELLLQQLNKQGEVEYAEKIPVNRIISSANDPNLATQWHLSKIKAQEVWNLPIGTSTTIVAVVDNAVQSNHVDLAANMVAGYDVSDDDNDPNPPNIYFSHGTHVSGIVGAVTNNNIGIASLGYNKVKVMPIKTTRDEGYYNSIEFGYEGIVWAANHGAKIISCSWGGGGYFQTGQDVINDAKALGAIVVAAAGNANTSIKAYPASFDHVISVASTNINDVKSGFSNYGSWVDIAAPGSGILSTVPFDGYDTYSGTSMAAPLVSSLLGYIFSVNSSLTNSQAESLLKATADKIDASGTLGGGRINAYRAIKYANCVNSMAALNSGNNNICYGQSTNLSVSALPNNSYQWFRDGISVSTSNTNAIIVNQTGIYHAVRMDTIMNCLSISQEINILVTKIDKIKVNSPAPVCSPATQNLNLAILNGGSSLNNFTLSYWKNVSLTIPANSPTAISESGIYYVKADSASCIDVKPIAAIIVNLTAPKIASSFEDCNQNPKEIWKKNYGGLGIEVVYNTISTLDGGYIFSGSSNSDIYGNKSSPNYGGLDYWVVRIDKNGEILWQNSYGGDDNDFNNKIIATNDGGFIICGISASGISGNKTIPFVSTQYNYYDIWMIKIDGAGNIQWEKSIDSGNDDDVINIQKTNDGNFILGHTHSTVSLITKINQSGNIIWSKSLSPSGRMSVLSKAMPDGSFFVGYQAYSLVTSTIDYGIRKIDYLGNEIWDKNYGGDGADYITTICLSNKDNFALLGGGSSSGLSGDVSEDSKGYYDMWILKINTLNGNKIWDKRLGGVDFDIVGDIIESKDDGFLVSGEIFGNNFPGVNGGTAIIKIDTLGNQIWGQSFYYAGWVNSILPMVDGSYLLSSCMTPGVGYIMSTGVVFEVQNIRLIKINACSEENYKDLSVPVKLTASNCMANITWSDGQTTNPIYVSSIGTYTANCNYGTCTSPSSESAIVNNNFTPQISVINPPACYNTIPTVESVRCDVAKVGNTFNYTTKLDKIKENGDIIFSGVNYTNSGIDFCLGKLNKSDKTTYTYGGDGNDQIVKTIDCADGGYMLGGVSNSSISGDKTEDSFGEFDFWLLKIDANGQKQWDKTYGGSADDQLTGLSQTPDGGFIVVGITTSPISGTITLDRKGLQDAWVIKINQFGNKVWEKRFGGTGTIHDVKVQTMPSGSVFLFADGYNSSGEDFTDDTIEKGFWLLKLNGNNGNKVWDKRYGPNGNTGAFTRAEQFEISNDGHLILGGVVIGTNSGNITEPSRGGLDIWMIKADTLGNVIWDKRLGGSRGEYISTIHNAIQSTDDGGVVLMIKSDSDFDFDISPNVEGKGAWIVKLDKNGSKVWDKMIGTNQGGVDPQSFLIDNIGNLYTTLLIFGNDETGMFTECYNGLSFGGLAPRFVKLSSKCEPSNLNCVENAVLKVNGCQNNINWSTGASTITIGVAQTNEQSNYTVTCNSKNATLISKSVILNPALTISQPFMTGTHEIRAANTITSNSLISTGANVSLISRKSITLTTGTFNAQSGSVFLAKIGACKN